jgi:hypothetical protein
VVKRAALEESKIPRIRPWPSADRLLGLVLMKLGELRLAAHDRRAKMPE